MFLSFPQSPHSSFPTSSSATSAMAFPSPSSHNHPSYSGKWEWDVFVCFRGDDTRRSITSHLMTALSGKQIKAFYDSMLQKTECIDELLSVLRRSALSIVIFSENFADSPWCLDEVATISQSMKDFGHWALPVFYNVGWSEVADDSGRYAATIDALDATEDSKKNWRDALKVVADRAGLTSKQIKVDAELVEAIVENVLKKLNDMSPSIAYDNLVGMGARVKKVEQLLALNTSDDIRIIGLWGMGGLGKTTLARTCYQVLNFSTMKEHKHHFVEKVHENWEKQHGVGGLVQELYSTLLSEKDLSREDLNSSYRRARLSRLRVFLVLDDVQTLSQLEQLLLGEVMDLTKLFAPGSRIIVTTRNRRVLEYTMAKIYQVECLDNDESLQLFDMFAFRERLPPDDWMDLSHMAVSYCKGNPLALKVLGGALFCQERNYWRDFLGELRQIQNPEIHHVLRRSYDKLAANEQRLFLDVACFHCGMRKSTLINYMATSYPSAYSKVKDLVDKSLFVCVSNKEGEIIEVHDLLKEMAWSIVNEEPKLENRSRLEDPDDIHKLLENQNGQTWTAFGWNLWTYAEADGSREDRTTEGIFLDLSKVKEMHLKGNAFDRMNRLRFLKFWRPESCNTFPIHKKIHLPYGGLNSLPDGLTFLHWDGFPSRSLPSTFAPENLVRLVIRHSPIKRCWAGVQPNLVHLVLLDLSYCLNLTAVPDLSRCSNLEELLLRGCKSLVELPSYVQYLDKLSTLDLGDCKNLASLPAKFNSKFLSHFELSNCSKVFQCPEINSAELGRLGLDGTPIKQLPCAIHNLKQGAVLHLCGNNISSFPRTSQRLEWLRLCSTAIEEIDFDDHQASSELLPRIGRLEFVQNYRLKTLPSCVWKMVSTELIIEASSLIESLPEITESIDGFIRLVIVGCTRLKSVPSGIGHLKSLLGLSFSGSDIQSLPSSIQELDQLFYLDLSYCTSLEAVPNTIYKLSALAGLFLRGCRRIRSLPQLPPKLEFMDVGNCKSLESLPSNFLRVIWRGICFDGCQQLDKNLVDLIIGELPDLAARTKRSEATLIYSGSELPCWFCYNTVYDKEDCCVTVELPAADCIKGPVKAVVFGIVFSYQASGFVNVQATLDCYVESLASRGWGGRNSSHTTTVASWKFSLKVFCERDASDLVYLRADSRLGGTKEATEEEAGEKEEEEAWYVKYAGRSITFRLCTRAANEGFVKNFEDNFEIKCCGANLVYS